MLFYVIINFYKNYFIIIILLYFFSIKIIILFFHVPGCSGMFRVPGFIDVQHCIQQGQILTSVTHFLLRRRAFNLVPRVLSYLPPLAPGGR